MAHLGSIDQLSTALSIVAPTLTSSRSIPQSVHIIRSGAEGVSQGTWLLVVGVAELWVVYGFLYPCTGGSVTNVPNYLMAVLILVWQRTITEPLSKTISSICAVHAPRDRDRRL